MKKLFAIALFLICAPSAHASNDVPSMMANARVYWQAQGVPNNCTEVTWDIVVLPDGFAGLGGGCNVKFDPVAVRYERSVFCHVVLHEYGHALGLMHEDLDRFPIMAPDQRAYEVRTPWCDGGAKIGVLRGAVDARSLCVYRRRPSCMRTHNRKDPVCSHRHSRRSLRTSTRCVAVKASRRHEDRATMSLLRCSARTRSTALRSLSFCRM